MSLIRTENSQILWNTEIAWGIMNPQPNFPFGIFEVLNAPDPSIAWYPFWGGASGGRSRSDIFPGPWTLRGSIPDIRLQRAAGGGISIALVSLGIGSVIPTPGSAQYVRIVEGLPNNNEEIISFTMQVAMKASSGNIGTFPYIIRNYIGGKISRWTLAANEGDSLRYTIDEMMFRTVHHNLQGIYNYDPNVTLATPLIPQSGDPRTRGSQFYFAGANIVLGGVSLFRVKSFSLAGDNQLQPKYYQSSAMVTDQGLVPPNGGNEPQTLADLPVGKRRYQMSLETEIGDTFNDMPGFIFLLQEGRDPLTGDVVGIEVDANFASTAGSQPGGAFNIHCFPFGVGYPPAAVVTDGSMNMPAPPAPYWDGRFTLDLNSIYIDATVI